MKSVLSVQSHVVHGYVGGRAATFPLQYLGWDVDVINTVNFSNHTGYGQVKGAALLESDMQSLFDGLRNISCRYDAVISGYIPARGLIDKLAENVASMKRDNPSLFYTCDPVMGDQGHLYVDNSCVQAYKDMLSRRLVDLITPNQFELELLCGFSVDSKAELKRALDYLHSEFGIKHIVVSSLTGAISFLDESEGAFLYCAVSTKGASNVEVFKVPEIKSYFTGVGDLFTALLLDKFTTNAEDLALAVSQVLSIMSRVLKLTHVSGLQAFCRHQGIQFDPELELDESLIQSKINDKDTMRFFELRVIESKQFYESSDTIDHGSIKI